MVKLRIKIDVWSQGMDEMIREEIRGKLRDLFCQLPPRRLWHYLKHLRNLEFKNSVDSGSSNLPADVMDGPEDVIANSTATFPIGLDALAVACKADFSIVCQLFRTKDLGRMMYSATINQVHITKNPDFSLKADITFDEKGVRLFGLVKHLTFGHAGKFSSHTPLSLLSESIRLLSRLRCFL
jgi:hypothetical protein